MNIRPLLTDVYLHITLVVSDAVCLIRKLVAESDGLSLCCKLGLCRGCF